MDYAGLANDYLSGEGAGLGTNTNGRILECELADGTAKISVVLSTQKALGFAQSLEEIIDNSPDFPEEINFVGTPTIFGNKAQDTDSGPGVESGAEAAVGPAHLSTSFIIEKPGDPLPDLVPAFGDNERDVRSYTFDFRSTTVGTLPDGTKARLSVQQVCAADAGEGQLCSREIVDLNRE